MSLGTITLNLDEGRSGGPYPLGEIEFLGDDAYPTGGTPGFQDLVRAAFPEKPSIEVFGVLQQSLSDHVARYDRASDTLIVQLMSTGAEVPDTTDLSGTTFKLLVFGK